MALVRISNMTAAGTLTGDELVELSQLSTSVTKTATTISATASDNSYNDSGAGFVAAGFAINDVVRVTGFTGDTANNIHSAVVTAVTTTKLTIGGTDGNVIVDDAAGESVTITKWETRRKTLFGDGLGALDVGFRAIPQNSKSANYTCVAADSGKHIFHPAADTNARTFTIPANSSVAYPVGTVLTFVNETTEVVSIAITTDTLTLAGTASTGTRSLAINGIATAIKITSTKWLINGSGLT